MNRKEILDAASEAVLKNRQNLYGPPEQSFTETASVWSIILGNGVSIQPWQVPLMLAGLKIIRAKASPQHADNWVDLAGYAACGGELAKVDTKPNDGITLPDGVFYNPAKDTFHFSNGEPIGSYGFYDRWKPYRDYFPKR